MLIQESSLKDIVDVFNGETTDSTDYFFCRTTSTCGDLKDTVFSRRFSKSITSVNLESIPIERIPVFTWH